MDKENSYGVILAGGGGTRLWPKSRNCLPKQFLKLGFDETLLQMTFGRLEEFLPAERIFIVTVSDYVSEIKKELPKIVEENILIEPSPRNTAPAIALAVWKIYQKNPQAIIGSFAADHLVLKRKEFLAVLEAAYTAAKNTKNIIAVGIAPTKPDDGLGYIHVGGPLEDQLNPVFKVKQFVEKPNLATAQAYLASGEYFWNASYFVGKAKIFLEEYRQHFPEVLKALENMESTGKTTDWNSLPSIAVDYAIMEKINNLVMVTGDIGWSDVGSWSVLSEIFPATKAGNIELKGQGVNYLTEESKNCLLLGEDRLIAILGVTDLVIVDTKDALLVCHKDKAQEVKKIVEKIKEKKLNNYL